MPLNQNKLEQYFTTLGEFSLDVLEFKQWLMKTEGNWLLPMAYLYQERGMSCTNFKLAAKVFNIENQEQLLEKIESLSKQLQYLKEGAEQLPKQRFWEEDNGDD